MEPPRAGTTRFALRQNSRIAYDPGSSTPATGPDQPVFLLLHDLLADRGAFAAQSAWLAAGARVVVPDARGHGASASLLNQWYSVAELAQDALAVLDSEGIARAHVVGHGLGGATAFELARRAPARVITLTLIEPALYGVLDNDREPAAVGLRNELRASDRAAADAAYKGLTDKALETYLLPRWGAGWREALPKPRLGAIRRHAGGLAGLLPALDSYAPAKGDLGALTFPVTIATGEDAAPIAGLVAARLAERLPAAEQIVLPLGPRAGQPFAGPAAEPLNALLLRLIDRNE